MHKTILDYIICLNETCILHALQLPAARKNDYLQLRFYTAGKHATGTEYTSVSLFRKLPGSPSCPCWLLHVLTGLAWEPKVLVLRRPSHRRGLGGRAELVPVITPQYYSMYHVRTTYAMTSPRLPPPAHSAPAAPAPSHSASPSPDTPTFLISLSYSGQQWIMEQGKSYGKSSIIRISDYLLSS